MPTLIAASWEVPISAIKAMLSVSCSKITDNKEFSKVIKWEHVIQFTCFVLCGQ